MEYEVLAGLIEQSYGTKDATQFRNYKVTDDDVKLLADSGREVLQRVPTLAGACMMMSALYAAMLMERTKAPVYLVAGALGVEDVMVYGKDEAVDGKKIFQQSSLSWDGHGWVVLGCLIADVSLFRTAYSDAAHPRLKQHVLSKFGSNRGLMIAPASGMARDGLVYIPQYVVQDRQITALVRGAIKALG